MQKTILYTAPFALLLVACSGGEQAAGSADTGTANGTGTAAAAPATKPASNKHPSTFVGAWGPDSACRETEQKDYRADGTIWTGMFGGAMDGGAKKTGEEQFGEWSVDGDTLTVTVKELDFEAKAKIDSVTENKIETTREDGSKSVMIRCP